VSIAFSGAWALEMYESIKEIAGSLSHEELPYWLVAMCAASAYRTEDFDYAVAAIEDLRARYNEEADAQTKCSMVVSLGYLCFYLWRYAGGEIKWRKDQRMEKRFEKGVLEMWRGRAISYSRQAYKAARASERVKEAIKIYATNLFVFTTTEAGNQREFRNIIGMVDELSESEIHKAYWQYRFDDTLARFFHRRSKMRAKKARREFWLNKAIELVNKAKARSWEDPEVEAYANVLANAEVGAPKARWS
jgi:hypothetical protein